MVNGREPVMSVRVNYNGIPMLYDGYTLFISAKRIDGVDGFIFNDRLGYNLDGEITLAEHKDAVRQIEGYLKTCKGYAGRLLLMLGTMRDAYDAYCR